MRYLLASLLLLAACDSNVTYQTGAPVDAVMQANSYSMEKRLKLGYQAAERWVHVDDSARRKAAIVETRHLMHEVVSPALARCLGTGFAPALEEKLYSGLTDPALFNAIAADWYDRYNDAQLDELHRVATSGGTLADIDAGLFPAGTAPTEASLAAAPHLAAQAMFAEPQSFSGFVRDWMTSHAKPHCPIPANETEWQEAIRYEAFYIPRGDAW